MTDTTLHLIRATIGGIALGVFIAWLTYEVARRVYWWLRTCRSPEMRRRHDVNEWFAGQDKRNGVFVAGVSEPVNVGVACVVGVWFSGFKPEGDWL